MIESSTAEIHLSAKSPVIVSSPARNVRAHQRLEHATMIANPEMEKLVHDDKILKSLRPLCQISGEGHNAVARA